MCACRRTQPCADMIICYNEAKSLIIHCALISLSVCLLNHYHAPHSVIKRPCRQQPKALETAGHSRRAVKLLAVSLPTVKGHA